MPVLAAVANALRLGRSRPQPSTVLVSAHGDIDASNAGDLVVFVSQATGSGDRVVLDLTGVDFFGTAGLSALCALDGGEGEVAASRMAVVPSRSVTRLLQLCQPSIRLARNLDAALTIVQGDSPPL